MPQIDASAKNLIKYFQKQAKRGYPEARRDWLYAPAYVPGGAWNAEQLLDDVIRRAKDLGAETGFELIYVYNRPPCWTCEPSDYIRNKAEYMEFTRELSAMERWALTSPRGSLNEALAAA